jgi:annexin A7/11
MYGKDLINELKSELSGNFEGVVLAVMEPARLYDAKCLRRAMRGPGTDEAVLIEILCTRTSSEIYEIVEAYKKGLLHVCCYCCISFVYWIIEFKRNLEKDVVSETSGHFKRLLVSMCQVCLCINLSVISVSLSSGCQGRDCNS